MHQHIHEVKAQIEAIFPGTEAKVVPDYESTFGGHTVEAIEIDGWITIFQDGHWYETVDSIIGEKVQEHGRYGIQLAAYTPATRDEPEQVDVLEHGRYDHLGLAVLEAINLMVEARLNGIGQGLDYEAEQREKASAVIREIIESTSGNLRNPWYFYRCVYKSVSCGPMIGFKIDGSWVYGDELPNDIGAERIHGISVSSIVEGSDVEIPPTRFDENEEFTATDFWDAVDAVNKEAEFYWERDNTDWFRVWEHDTMLSTCHWTAFDGGLAWDDEPEDPLVKDIVEAAIKREYDKDMVPLPIRIELPGHGISIEGYENDSTY
jgi:hypothetical protein